MEEKVERVGGSTETVQTPISIVLVLLSAFFHAVWNYYGKASRSPQLFFFWIGDFYSRCGGTCLHAATANRPEIDLGLYRWVECHPFFILVVLEPRLYVW